MTEPVLTLGEQGAAVGSLQQSLIEQGFDCGDDAVTRIFGPATESEVKLFQACHMGPDKKPLAVDGIVGAATWWALDHPSGSAQHQPVDGMPVQQASNPIAQAALDSAWAELRKGVAEYPDGSNRGTEIDLYTGMAGKPLSIVGPPWCAYFVSWNFAKAPGGSPFGWIGGAQSIVAWCQKHIPSSVFDMTILLSVDGRAGSPYVPRCGDIGVIANGQVHGHAIQVAAAQAGDVWTVEGNCGNAVRSEKRLISSFRWFVNFDAYARAKITV